MQAMVLPMEETFMKAKSFNDHAQGALLGALVGETLWPRGSIGTLTLTKCGVIMETGLMSIPIRNQVDIMTSAELENYPSQGIYTSVADRITH